ncbi:MAG: biosynthetic-type acetolactate synthase large subunit [Anaerolineales bacterium]|nr:biosynthetic-type acetolactate synthase large subunit [Anaerolineales bacterium]
MKKSGAEVLWESLIREGVDVLFGIPGGAVIPAFDAMLNYPKLKFILARHEECAAMMADGYARASRKVGVAIATSGPGATNLVTGIQVAFMDSSPVVFITGQVASNLLGSDAFQETDMTGISLPITKHNFLITSPDQVAQTVREAFYIARSGRPGPVLIDFCKDAQVAKTDKFDPPEIRLLGYHPPEHAAPEKLEKAAELIRKSKRPIIFAGHGVEISGAGKEVQEFAERTNMPVAMTLLSLGSIPSSHPLSLGMMGMHGEAYCNQSIQNADLILALGMRFDDRVTGNLKTYAPGAAKIHVDIDPAEINKIVKSDVSLVGDVKMVLKDLNPMVANARHDDWLAQINQWRKETDDHDIVAQPNNGYLNVPQIINDIWRVTKGEALVVTDVGQHQMWAAQYYQPEKPYSFITSGGAGSMGFGLPAAIGAKVAKPEREVWAIVGDGGFQMTQMDLITAVKEGIEIKIALMNNHFLGMVRQWQEFFFEKRYSAVQLRNPDFGKIAEAHGAGYRRIEKPGEVPAAVEFARKTPGPVLLDFHVQQEEAVYPMVPTGADLHQMIRRPAPEERK